jgi:carbonic anhydrase
MGHSQCGAILATVEEALGRTSTHSQNLRSIVDRIRPAVETMLSRRDETDPNVLMQDAVRANVRVAVDHLKHGSALIEQLVRNERLVIVGAEYSLETGVVSFFDGVPTAGQPRHAGGASLSPC